MSRLGALLAAAICAGCAAPPAAVPPPPREVAWRVVRAPFDGFVVAMPAAVREISNLVEGEGGEATTHGFEASDGPVEMRALRMSVKAGVDERAVLDRVRRMVDTHIAERDAPARGFAGREIEGERAGVRIMVRMVVMGRTVYSLSVEAPQAAFDPAAARLFLDSLQIEVPFRVAASTEGRFVVAVPSPAPVRGLSDDAFFRGYQGAVYPLGGDADLAYAAAWRTLPPGQPPAEQLLADVVAALGEAGALAVQRSTPVRLGDLAGLEARYDGRRVQVFTNGARLFVLAVLARDPARLDDADARRFFASLRVAD